MQDREEFFGFARAYFIRRIDSHTVARAHELRLAFFVQWYAWITIWAGIMIFALGSFGACRFVSLVTRFSCEIFGFLIGVIYLIRFDVFAVSCCIH